MENSMKAVYTPSSRDHRGKLSIQADTKLGLFVWDQELPRPLESEEGCDLVVSLCGKSLQDFPGDLPDFGAPNAEGKAAKRFAASLIENVTEALDSWVAENAEDLAEICR